MTCSLLTATDAFLIVVVGPNKEHQLAVLAHHFRRTVRASIKFSRFSIQTVAHPSGTNLQLAAETCAVHGTLMYIKYD